MTRYNWQQPDWPHFSYDLTHIHEALCAIAERSGFVSGKFIHLPQSLQTETVVDLMVEEAVNTSKIEGERIDPTNVRSSIKNQLGLNPEKIPVHDKNAQGIASLMLDVRNTFNTPLTQEKLFSWHKMLLGHSLYLNTGVWRTHTEPMQIISGYHGKKIIHFEAPPSIQVATEMEQFLNWFNNTAPKQKNAIKYAPVRAAIAHLYFESIHPFEDGNGRIGRAIAEKALSQGMGYPSIIRLSHVIEKNKKAYYNALHTASYANEITPWIIYFTDTIFAAQQAAEQEINFILKKYFFFEKFKEMLNERQLKVIKSIFKEGSKGFEGGMSAKKYMAITHTSKATATRDLTYLLDIGVFKQTGSGRSVRYYMVLDVGT